MRTLLIWELGGNLGHLVGLSAAANALIARGHEPWLAVPNLHATHQIVDFDTVRVVHGPTLPDHGSGAPPRTWADLVTPNVFHDPVLLASGLHAWRALIDAIAPDAVVFDSAPMAMLATRGLPVRKIPFEYGWAAPPRTTPLPALRPDVSDADREAADASALEVVHAGCRRAGIAPPQTLADLFDADETLIRAFPELDHYPETPGRHYVGPTFGVSSGTAPRWPGGDGPKAFVYLRADHPLTVAMILTLAQLGVRVLAFVPHLTAEGARAITHPLVRYTAEPLRMDEVREQCDLGVCHSMTGTGPALALAGVPVMAMPLYVEQLLIGAQAASSGVATLVPYHTPTSALPGLIESALSARSRSLVRRFARRHRRFLPETPLQAVCDAVEGRVIAV